MYVCQHEYHGRALIYNIQGVSENTDTFLSLPALVLITAQTLLGARINPWILEIHIHRLSSPFEPLPGNWGS